MGEVFIFFLEKILRVEDCFGSIFFFDFFGYLFYKVGFLLI